MSDRSSSTPPEWLMPSEERHSEWTSASLDVLEETIANLIERLTNKTQPDKIQKINRIQEEEDEFGQYHMPLSNPDDIPLQREINAQWDTVRTCLLPNGQDEGFLHERLQTILTKMRARGSDLLGDGTEIEQLIFIWYAVVCLLQDINAENYLHGRDGDDDINYDKASPFYKYPDVSLFSKIDGAWAALDRGIMNLLSGINAERSPAELPGWNRMATHFHRGSVLADLVYWNPDEEFDRDTHHMNIMAEPMNNTLGPRSRLCYELIVAYEWRGYYPDRKMNTIRLLEAKLDSGKDANSDKVSSLSSTPESLDLSEGSPPSVAEEEEE
ncbi:hypothetical protein EJ05DRAFT_102556 [Pseudovirgaria hyperparasitica]|uniref:Uncharacterized protein n=1 Tax=Pseudovirgaria hyperparasitica TaxID=470096 RepID=A0A6A6VYW4_9PEZI|nr:uncharacterized protein EJ05DRAFT_102556 [Pseudovirgaria hyperparasitica]KAF2755473.1 hypothetical protein EJ05DRAFT_102556 [Pseudovirgaria hyperparasitica]